MHSSLRLDSFVARKKEEKEGEELRNKKTWPHESAAVSGFFLFANQLVIIVI